MKQQITKGQIGYLRQKRNITLLWTVVLFSVSASLYLGGIVATGDKKNLLTIVAILGLLPAVRSLINAFMFCKAKGCPKDLYDAHEAELATMAHHYYDLVFTTSERAYNVPVLVIREGNLCGLCLDEGKSLKDLEEHIESCLKKEKLHANVSIWKVTDQEKFFQRITQLKKLEEKENNRDAEMTGVLFEITL